MVVTNGSADWVEALDWCPEHVNFVASGRECDALYLTSSDYLGWGAGHEGEGVGVANQLFPVFGADDVAAEGALLFSEV